MLILLSHGVPVSLCRGVLQMPWLVPAGLSVAIHFFSFIQGVAAHTMCYSSGMSESRLWIAVAGTLFKALFVYLQ